MIHLYFLFGAAIYALVTIDLKNRLPLFFCQCILCSCNPGPADADASPLCLCSLFALLVFVVFSSYSGFIFWICFIHPFSMALNTSRISGFYPNGLAAIHTRFTNWGMISSIAVMTIAFTTHFFLKILCISRVFPPTTYARPWILIFLLKSRIARFLESVVAPATHLADKSASRAFHAATFRARAGIFFSNLKLWTIAVKLLIASYTTLVGILLVLVLSAIKTRASEFCHFNFLYFVYTTVAIIPHFTVKSNGTI